MFQALTSTLSIDDAYDLAEIDKVSRSHRDAAQANAEESTTARAPRSGRAR